MFSLCIPTMRRFELFLSTSLPKYLANDLIHEIIITDETGEDVDLIQSLYPSHPKLTLVKNPHRLGPLLNKLTACRLATREWIVLIDSDNYAPPDYFNTAKRYIETHSLSHQTILAPCAARPHFDYRRFAGMVFTRNWFATHRALQREAAILMNTGNYVLHKDLVTHHLSLDREPAHHIQQSSSCDVIYLNTLWFEQTDLQMHVVEGLEYVHAVHPGSVYLATYRQFAAFAHSVHQRFFQL